MPSASRLARAVAVATAALAVAPPAASALVDGRLEGNFTMHGTITEAEHVRGEHVGQHVTRDWRFTSKCASGPCDEVILHRERSAGKVDRVVLHRVEEGTWYGTNNFHFPIRCAGVVYNHGGEAFTKIYVRVTDVTPVGDTGQPFATHLKATYANPKRVNHTQCTGRPLGHDRAKYTGSADSVPGPPNAAFTWTPPPAGSMTVAFQDESTRGTGDAPIEKRRWSFGDPASGSANTASGRTPTHEFSAPGTYTVTLTVTDKNGVVSKTTHDVSV